MSSVAEIAFESYVASWQERDAALRLALLEKCWAADGRFVTGGTVVRGREALCAYQDKFANDPREAKIQMIAPPDVQGKLFRLRAHAVFSDGTVSPESFEAGELDADGRIQTILTFKGP